MPRKVDCPFCGVRGSRTKEHVWAQWLHETPGATALLEGTHGERIPSGAVVLDRGADGRYEACDADGRTVAQWLPNVTVAVCDGCNGGWMSRLESETKRILGPFIFDDERVLRLSVDDITTLATWATKSWMAYALLYPTQHNPFTEDEYRKMAADPAPLARSRIWIMHSREPTAHVSMGLAPTLFTFGAPGDLTMPDNTAYAFLAVSTVVFFMVLVPEDAPEFALATPSSGGGLAPPMLDEHGVRRIWDTPRAQFFPQAEVPAGFLTSLVQFANTAWQEMGLPTAGLTDDDAEAVFDEWMSGVDAKVIRKRWAESQPF